MENHWMSVSCLELSGILHMLSHINLPYLPIGECVTDGDHFQSKKKVFLETYLNVLIHQITVLWVAGSSVAER